MLRTRTKWPVYRFDFFYKKTYELGKDLCKCVVEIYAEGLENPTVVLSGCTTDFDNFAYACSQIRNLYLIPLGIDPGCVRWLLQGILPGGNSSWDEIILSKYNRRRGRYPDARLQTTEPFVFDWSVLRDKTAERTHRLLLTSDLVHPETFQFDKYECYKMAMGVCSLNRDAKLDDGRDENSYNHCRGLAHWAQIWDLTREYFGGDIPWGKRLIDPVFRDPQLIDYVESRISVAPLEYGATGDIPQLMIAAIGLFGALRGGGVYGSQRIGEQIRLGDGHHRACVCKRLGIPLAAFVAVEENPITPP